MLAVTALATTGLLASSPPANAAFTGQQLGTSKFEIDTDANLTVDGPTGNIDWLDGGAIRARFADQTSGSGDDSFGNGTKEDDAVPSVIDGSIPPNKSDLKFFGVYQETTPAFAQYLHLYWSRVQDPSGTTNMDFEFNKSATLSSNGITPERSPGDLLITYDLSRGGTVPTLSKRTWTGSVWGAETSLTGNAIGSINATAITAANSGGASGIGGLDPRTFGEATIDLNALFGTGCASFGSAYLKSRSSDSFTSAVKDFIAPRPVNVSNCGSVAIHKQDDAGTALAGATFTLYTNVAPLTAPRGAGDTATALTCTTNASGDCTISNVPFGSYWIVETVTPTDHDPAADQAVNVAPGGNTPTGTFTFVNNRQRGSIIVRKNDGGGAFLGGASFTVSKTGFTSALMTEVATGLFCLDNLLYGTYTVTESTVPGGYTGASPQNFAVSSRSTCDGRLGSPVNTGVTADLTFTNNQTPGTVNIAKTDDLSNPLAGASFTLFVDNATPGTRGVYDSATDTTVQAGPTQTDSGGAIQWTNVPVGYYCAVETGTPVGYDTAAAQCFYLAQGTTANTGSIQNLTFVDNRQHRIVVLVCHEGTDTLTQSSVTLAGTGGSTKISLGAGSLTAAQQKALCDTGGASYGNLSGHTERSLTVTPGSH
jgi:hypothetical protein